MKPIHRIAIAFAAFFMMQACDKQVPQTVLVHAENPAPPSSALRLVESGECKDAGTAPGWSSNGLWIFNTSSIRGGVGAVTQELSICIGDVPATSNRAWHSIHGGGAPLLVLSCDFGEGGRCKMYQDGYDPGTWTEDP